MNPYLKRASLKGESSHGKYSEKRLAKNLKARSTIASGALRGDKGDFTLKTNINTFRFEAKSTKNNSISIELGWLRKIVEESLNTNATPVITISFVTPEGKSKNADWVMIPITDFKELIGE